MGEICGSWHSLKLSDASLQESFISITFHSFKFSGGRCPCVFISTFNGPLCLVQALWAYLDCRGIWPGFLFLDGNGVPCTLSSFCITLRSVVKGAGLESHGISPHSFRVGTATSEAAIGIPDDTIQRMGGEGLREHLPDTLNIRLIASSSHQLFPFFFFPHSIPFQQDSRPGQGDCECG